MRNLKALYAAFTLLALLIIFQILNVTGLEFRTEKLVDDVRNYTFIVFWIATLSIALLSKRNLFGAIARISLFIVAFFTGLYWLLIKLPFPEETKVKLDGDVMFIHKHDPNRRIMEQLYFSGITGSNENYDTVETRNLTENIRWTRAVDIKTIDTSIWEKQVVINSR